MQRKAVAASIVSALIFSSLLLSAYTLNEAFRERFRFSEYSDMENKLYIQEEILSAATAFKLLGMEQEFLESNSLECNSSSALPAFFNICIKRQFIFKRIHLSFINKLLWKKQSLW